MLIPVWDTDIVYNESLMMLEENGETSAPLLYEPLEILSVQNAALLETYEEGRDWFLKSGRIYLTESSRIFKFTQEQLYPAEKIEGGSFPKGNGGYILFGEGHFFHDRQIVVTYTCKKGQWKGYIPKYTGDNLPCTMERLKKDKCLNLVLFGDSIAAGANASQMTGVSPFQPIWGDLLAENLRRNYGAAVHFSNPSVGGTATNWAIENADKLVNPLNPDLVIIAFGMNDRVHGDEFIIRIRKIMDIIKEKDPRTEFILVSTSLPNPLLTLESCQFYRYQHEYKEALEALCKEGVILCNIRDMQSELLKHKRFIDMTGNHVNHPNDFFIRCHAQNLSCLLIP